MNYRRKFNDTWMLLVLAAVIGFHGCAKHDPEEARSMVQIQKEEGFPVTLEKVTPQDFSRFLSFTGRFDGEMETTIGAMIGGRIDKIHYHPGDVVKKDAVVIEFPEDSPASQYQQAQTAYELSKKNYERMKTLFDKGEISRAQFDGVQTKYEVDKRNYETMHDMLKLDAPYDGTITEVMVREGDNVKDKTPLFTIAKLDKMKIRIWLSEKERSQIKKGMRAEAAVNDKRLMGTITELSMSVNPMKQAFYADLSFDNSHLDILPGTTADVWVYTYEKKNAISVPRNLVLRDGDQAYVFKARDGTARKQTITLGSENGINYEILSGLSAGDSLIIKGVARLEDGFKINIVK